MFTPAGADATGHLQPWLCLVVVRKATSSVSVVANRPLPVLQCQRDELPDLAEAWAWAHAQIVEGATPVMDPALEPSAQSSALDEMLKRNPERSLSRLVCPRRLDPDVGYYACVVPTFAVGCKAGLGEEATVDEEAALKPAWGSTDDPPVTRLPVYFHWEFSTGSEGDFEALARRLVPRALPPAVGLRPMDISDPGWGMPTTAAQSAGAVLGLEGALRTTDTEPTPWDAAARQTYQSALRKILNAPSEQSGTGSEPLVVGPPLYGQWHAKQRQVPGDEELPHWFRELNLDPRHRVAAGLGTAAVRFEQEPLMASAWEQLARHEQDQEHLKRAQLSEAVGEVLGEKHFEPLPDDRFFQLAAPLRQRARAGWNAAAIATPVPPAPMLSVAYRRLSRPAGPIARRGATAAIDASRGSDEARATAPDTVRATRARAMRAALLRGIDPAESMRAAAPADTATTAGTELARFAPAFPQPMYEALRDYFPDSLLPGLEQVPFNTITLLETNPRFIEAYMVGVNHEMSRELVWRGFPADQRGTYFRQFWDIRGRVPRPATAAEQAALADIPDLTSWPDAAHLGENSASAGRSSRSRPDENRACAGQSSHSRPDENRASAGRASPSSPDENRASAGRASRSRAGGSDSQGQLVLLLRGDLLRRYPRAIVYAAEAVWSSDRTRRELGTTERYPLFRATRQPDVTMLGFALTDTEARGADTAEQGQAGWFFVLQEQPTEPRFGLDVAVTFGGAPERWSDLSWGHLAADRSALGKLAHVPLDGPLAGKIVGGVPWARNSAHMAFITRQRPFRVAVHARTWLTISKSGEA
jgi:hypothetical protein